jgi:hypothetical protein
MCWCAGPVLNVPERVPRSAFQTATFRGPLWMGVGWHCSPEEREALASPLRAYGDERGGVTAKHQLGERERALLVQPRRVKVARVQAVELEGAPRRLERTLRQVHAHKRRRRRRCRTAADGDGEPHLSDCAAPWWGCPASLLRPPSLKLTCWICDSPARLTLDGRSLCPRRACATSARRSSAVSAGHQPSQLCRVLCCALCRCRCQLAVVRDRLRQLAAARGRKWAACLLSYFARVFPPATLCMEAFPTSPPGNIWLA